MHTYLSDSPRQLLHTAVLFVVCLIFFDLSSADLYIQHSFFQTSDHVWLWPKREPLARFFLYDGIKYLLITFAITLLAALAGKNRLPRLAPYRRRIAIVLLSLALVPLLVGGLKTLTNVPCPHAVEDFGGQYPYIGVLAHLQKGAVFWSGQRCFPAAHASSGFALFSLMVLFQKPHNQLKAFYFALILGWVMGIYKMAIGDHFLSHTLASMLLGWWLFHLILVIDQYYFSGISLKSGFQGQVAQDPG